MDDAAAARLAAARPVAGGAGAAGAGSGADEAARGANIVSSTGAASGFGVG
ncbi:hypothetical protein [Leucobacter chromiiresistens]|uniref:hypothetical protein n=1 Tax=Leucobacter chromiiresistens TaxID=1079994 RepID=UPI00187BD6FA|nr:hypothetical protein [Leucobacter chromiiresistens]